MMDTKIVGHPENLTVGKRYKVYLKNGDSVRVVFKGMFVNFDELYLMFTNKTIGDICWNLGYFEKIERC